MKVPSLPLYTQTARADASRTYRLPPSKTKAVTRPQLVSGAGNGIACATCPGAQYSKLPPASTPSKVALIEFNVGMVRISTSGPTV